uniref:Uncharacterized protein n=1 Tax=Lepeophtheirus salmonis TaxID=72036 RepID=A0A0K2V6P2_LEPSM
MFSVPRVFSRLLCIFMELISSYSCLRLSRRRFEGIDVFLSIEAIIHEVRSQYHRP